MFHFKIFHNNAIYGTARLNLLSIHETGRKPCSIIIKAGRGTHVMSRLLCLLISPFADIPAYNDFLLT